MFTSTIELITLATSNSLLIFCFCNVIIGFLLLGGSKPSAQHDHDHDHDHDNATPYPTIDNRKRNDKSRSIDQSKNDINGSNFTRSFNKNNMPIEASCASYAEIKMIRDGEENEKEEDDELRKRVEEFIEKNNRGWKAEKLKTSPLV